ncbi:MAG TPA: flippase-like domain-containing protein [Candidatus Bathyarchaeia archaeon]|nr:flippase-like domain-containing protein [Candidatus Bathyarchaeia archaeon]
MRWIRLALLLGGAALFAWLVASIGPRAILAAFADLSWRLVVILVFPFGVTTLLDTLGWRYAFRRSVVPFPSLLAARLAGEAFNLTTPTASVGGEALKAWLVRPWVPLAKGLPSVVIAKTTIVIGQALFLVIGIAAAHAALPSDSLLIRGMQWLLVVQLVAVGGFVVVQASSALRGSTRWLEKAGWLRDQLLVTLTQINDELARFYRSEPARLTLSIFYHFLAWLIGVLEPWLILRWTGMPVSLAEAAAIEAFSTGIRFAAFLVPGYLGVLEAGHMAIFAALGLGAPAGLSFTLIRRIRELAWTGLGFLLLLPLKTRASAADASAGQERVRPAAPRGSRR